MKTLPFVSFNGRQYVAVTTLVKNWEGNHIQSRREFSGTLIDVNGNTLSVNEDDFQRHIAGAGIEVFRGYMTTGGGRHSFRGRDINDMKRWLADYKSK